MSGARRSACGGKAAATVAHAILAVLALAAITTPRSLIGGTQPLRGYGAGRFYDRNAFSATIELRQRIGRWEPYDGRLPRTVLQGAGGAPPSAY